MKTASEIESVLPHFTGSEEFYRHWTRRAVYTQGVQFLAESADCYWLIDLVVSHQTNPKVRAEEFQVWKLTVSDSMAVAICEDGDDNEVVRQDIPFTDFPMPSMTLWFVGGVLMLPSEY